ncbi:hypothetical protein FRAHR75_140019 [Frankia sp. Hr75.2]|nr:hypothetical protein FRAHR75_140019 [Frankia sp. Hr75.2]
MSSDYSRDRNTRRVLLFFAAGWRQPEETQLIHVEEISNDEDHESVSRRDRQPSAAPGTGRAGRRRGPLRFRRREGVRDALRGGQ